MVTLSLDRVLGCLLGGALGDALGYPVEFLDAAEIARRYGTEPPKSLAYAGVAPAQISDDTQMVLFSIEGILRARAARVRPDEAGWAHFLLGAYQRWYSTQTMRAQSTPLQATSMGPLVSDPRLHARRAPGNTCLAALAQSFVASTLASPDSPVNFSKGCGALMRSAPFGLAALTRSEAFQQAKVAGALTHGHPSGYLSAAYFASVIFDTARGVDLDVAMSHADVLLDRESEHDEVAFAVDRARRLATDSPQASMDWASLGQGWVGDEALGIALFCALRSARIGGGFIPMLWDAVVHDGDSDSTGALVGSLLGARTGTADLPAAWLDELEARDLIEQLSRELHAVVVGGDVDPERFPPVAGALLDVTRVD